MAWAMDRVEYLITVNHGLAHISADEIYRLIGRRPHIYDNYVRLRGSIDDAYKLIIWGRTIHRVYLVLFEDQFSSLDDIGKKVSELDYKELYPSGASFRLRTIRVGEHPFNSMDANRVVGGHINKALKESGLEPRVDLDNPDVEFVLRIVDDKFVFMVNLVGEALHRRMYRRFLHPASIKTSIAASMIMLSRWDDENFIDPMAGGGTIPIEAAMYRYNYAPGLYRESHPLTKLPLFNIEEYTEVRRQALQMRLSDKLPQRIIGNDISRRYVEGAKINAESAGVDKYIEFYNYDARLLHRKDVPHGDYVVVVNPPYGIRMTRMKVVPNLYRDVLASLYTIGASKVVSITARWREMLEAYEANGFKLREKLEVLHGRLTTYILVGEA